MKLLANLLVLFVVGATGCASVHERRAEKINLAAKNLDHLTQYREVECQVRVRYSEPTKTAWLKSLNLEGKRESAKFFDALEARVTGWRFTPYRCTMTPSREELSVNQQKVATDTETKLQSVFCIWLQGFYADSPLRSWAQNPGELNEVDGHVLIQKGESRGLEIRNSGQEIRALLGGSNSLRGVYQQIDGKLYPLRIEQTLAAGTARVDEITYVADSGRQLISSVWLSLPVTARPEPQAYLRAEVDSCQVNAK